MVMFVECAHALLKQGKYGCLGNKERRDIAHFFRLFFQVCVESVVRGMTIFYYRSKGAQNVLSEKLTQTMFLMQTMGNFVFLLGGEQRGFHGGF